ncbi:MAG: aminotransferase class V-fold PLP-dependent enzyme [Methanocalculus sp. MSAO_Arc1]|uniref:aminotransferase class V-fold PLP-dependent enzyme n=1 Tax=Methanocalculus TaxID=71151 RepID=UPI000FF5DE39|nr:MULTISPECIES: aminotransferase class V-fold PLP-dependent enzyme [unclassified Methanocalculus]MCP1662547.1 Sep-tRNA:Cys-tRNA synthetase [Methanocalculus sp. AMF5]RQD80081.1 MAG: aminotransferase class V-fold PLP-dependent enzyme [Methanocalculus sp. MSAO_Arc1]
MRCAGDIDVRQNDEMTINIDPIQVGGRLTADAMKAVIAYGDGYSVCDNCRKPFRLDYIKKPAIADFHADLASWLSMDTCRVVPGARRGFQAVCQGMVQKGDPVILTSLSHYTEFMAVESVGGVPREIPKNPKNQITANATAETIEKVIRTDGRRPALLFVEGVDYQFGNHHEVKGIAEVAHSYDIPVLYNGAYTVGILPVSGKDLGVDFVIGSGHKSMAAPAPSGLVATTEEYADRIFATTAVKGDLTGRTFGIKEVSMMGCTLMGVTLMGMMASFPHVKERVSAFDRELENAGIIIDALCSIEGTTILSEMPRRHTLTRIDTRESFDRVAATHKKRGFFLSSALAKRGISGVIPGATKVWKFNTYGMSRVQAEYTAEVFTSIAAENGLTVND